MNNKNFSIAYITDNHYITPTVVSVTSLFLNKGKETNYDVYILLNNVSKKNLKLLKKLKEQFKSVTLLEAGSLIKKYIHTKQQRHVTTSALLKFFLPNIFENNDKILYLDSDTIIRTDLSDLFEINLNDCYAGVIKDTLNIINPKYKIIFNINNKYYFNSGVMLLNLKKMREDNISEKLIEDKINNEYHFMDQDTFNKIFGDNVKYLSYKYNFLNYYIESCSVAELSEFFEETLPENEMDLYQSCSIIHFGGSSKPWIHDMEFLSKIFNEYYMKSILKNKKLKLLKSPFKKYFRHKIFSLKDNYSGTKTILTILGFEIELKKKDGK